MSPASELEEEGGEWTAAPLVSLNHVSFVCRSVPESVKFYEEVLGFTRVKRPSSFDFKGAWLHSYGIGIHLLQCGSGEGTPRRKGAINPKDNHISFQCSDVLLLRRRLERMGVEYVTAVVEEGGVRVNQIFFHDPDGHMIEICNCEDLPVLPLSSSCPGVVDFPRRSRAKGDEDAAAGEYYSKPRCCARVDEMIIENLRENMMHISL